MTPSWPTATTLIVNNRAAPRSSTRAIAALRLVVARPRYAARRREGARRATPTSDAAAGDPAALAKETDPDSQGDAAGVDAGVDPARKRRPATRGFAAIRTLARFSDTGATKIAAAAVAGAARTASSSRPTRTCAREEAQRLAARRRRRVSPRARRLALAYLPAYSLGSILLLAALGLAITYGLMGVINMAHGELIMIGAYATYVVQNLFRQYVPGAFDCVSVVRACPCAFAASALVGMALERTVIRYLYGRPLETLLATWGISLILIQAVRTIFGAQNVQVENPSWMSGGIEIMTDVVLPWSRIVIIVFAARGAAR